MSGGERAARHRRKGGHAGRHCVAQGTRTAVTGGGVAGERGEGRIGGGVPVRALQGRRRRVEATWWTSQTVGSHCCDAWRV